MYQSDRKYSATFGFNAKTSNLSLIFMDQRSWWGLPAANCISRFSLEGQGPDAMQDQVGLGIRLPSGSGVF